MLILSEVMEEMEKASATDWQKICWRVSSNWAEETPDKPWVTE